jgi:hypothetical protein
MFSNNVLADIVQLHQILKQLLIMYKSTKEKKIFFKYVRFYLGMYAMALASEVIVS